MMSRAMRAIAPKSLVVFSLFLVLSASAASTQAQATESLVFNIPFQFTAGDQRLPAGEYTVRRATQTGSAYFIQSRDARAAATVNIKNTLPADQKVGQARLTFNVYGGLHFLSQVRPGGDATGAEFNRSRAEREVAKEATDSRRVKVVAARK